MTEGFFLVTPCNPLLINFPSRSPHVQHVQLCNLTLSLDLTFTFRERVVHQYPLTLTFTFRKGLTINTAKSEVVHFNSHGFNVPAFSVGGAPLANKDSVKFLDMLFCRTHNIAKSAEHMLGPFMAGCHRIRQFAQEHHLNDRPHALLWLAKCYVIPASMYACQIWGARFMKQGSEFVTPFKLRICAFSKVCLV